MSFLVELFLLYCKDNNDKAGNIKQFNLKKQKIKNTP